MAKAQAREFAHGETVYREGGPGGRAFTVISGRVALSRDQDGAPQTLRIVECGEIFGELSVDEHTPRTETATAAGHVQIRALSRKELLRIVRKNQPSAFDASSRYGIFAPAFVQRFINAAWFRRMPADTAPSRLEVRVCGLADDSGSGQKRVLNALNELSGIRVRPLQRRFEIGPESSPGAVGALDAQIRRTAVGCGADLVVWGARTDSETPLNVRFTSRVRPDPSSAGAFGPWDILPLRDEPDPALDALLRAAALAALVPADAHRRSLHGRAFEPALKPAMDVVNLLPADLPQRERVFAHIAFAHISATASLSAGQSSSVSRDLSELAQEAYLQVLSGADEENSTLILRASAHKNLGNLMIGAEGKISEAVGHIEDALLSVERTETPWEWAALQDNLGTALYRLETSKDAASSKTLKKSLNAYRNAALVYTREEAPAKWASLQTGIARVAQILGKHRNDPQLLEQAIAACEQALLVRSRSRTPGLWASTQNNLGTALFLLAQMTGRDSALGYAAEAFRAALSVYKERGPVRMVATVERNLERVEGRMERASGRGAGVVDWAEIGGGPDSLGGAAEPDSDKNNRFSPHDLAPTPQSVPRAVPRPTAE
ncbi:MAG: cyclic nucleotide-binding domain-containing protein [Rhodospirillales bacterium]